MAKKRNRRLNRKLIVILLLIGIPILLIVGIAVDSRRPFLPGAVHNLLGRDPEQLRIEVDELIGAAEAVDQEIEVELSGLQLGANELYKRKVELKKEKSDPAWKEVFRVLDSAIRYSGRDDSLRTELLTFKSELLVRVNNYPGARKLWNMQFEEDATNYDAKRKSVNYIYEASQYRVNPNDWISVREQSEYLIKLRPKEVFGYLVKADSAIMLATIGGTELDTQELITEAGGLLDTVFSLDDDNIKAYKLYAELAMLQSENQVDEQEKAKSFQAAQSYLRKAIEKNPDSPEVYKNLFEIYLQADRKAKLIRLQEISVESKKEMDTAELEKTDEA